MGTKSQKSTINRELGKNENRNDAKSQTKNKPTGKDGKDRTNESESEFKTIEY